MKVTSVEPQKKNSRRFNVFLDDRFAFGADEDLIVNFRLLPGKEVDPLDLERLLYEAEVGKLMEKVYRLLSIRGRSEGEIRQYFRIKNLESRVKGNDQVSDLVIEQLIERCKTKGLLNDLEFARSWVEARRKSKQKGPRALRSELAQKGISREIIETVLNNDQLTVNNEQLATQALEKRLNRWQNLPPQEFKKKATDYLLRQGFDYSTIKKVIVLLNKKTTRP